MAESSGYNESFSSLGMAKTLGTYLRNYLESGYNGDSPEAEHSIANVIAPPAFWGRVRANTGPER